MSEKNYESPAVRKAVALVELLCDRDKPLGLSEISHELELNKHMVLRLLSTLEEVGWVVKNAEGPKYTVSLQPFHHASKAVRRMDLRSAAAHPMRELWEETGESTFLSILYRDTVMLLEHLDGVGSIRVSAHIGERYPLNCTAAGKALMAFGDPDLLTRASQGGFERPTPNSLGTLNELRKELKVIREQGFALDREECVTGVICVSAPVFDYAAQLAGVVGLTVFALNYTAEGVRDQLVPRLLATADKISQALGHTPDDIKAEG